MDESVDFLVIESLLHSISSNGFGYRVYSLQEADRYLASEGSDRDRT